MIAQFAITEADALSVKKYAKQSKLKRSQTMRLALQVGLRVLEATVVPSPKSFKIEEEGRNHVRES